MFLRLGEPQFAWAKVRILSRKIGSSPKRRDGSPKRRGPPRCGHVRLGDPEDRKMRPSSLFRQGCFSPR